LSTVASAVMITATFPFGLIPARFVSTGEM
jgi:hypothetical protein